MPANPPAGERETACAGTVEGRIGYRFRNPGLLQEALTHSSYVHENPGEGGGHNERLEFLGDAVVGLWAAHSLGRLFPEAREGELSRRRAVMVGEKGLAEVAISIGVGEFILLGRGEDGSGGREKPSILAGALEAIAGAVFLDGGWEAVCAMALKVFPPPDGGDLSPRFGVDPKTALQELCQMRCRETPLYVLLEQEGPSHSPRFTVAVEVAGKALAEGRGPSKRDAEQAAAGEALAKLKREKKP